MTTLDNNTIMPQTKKGKLIVAFVAWWLIWISIQFAVINDIGWSFKYAFSDAVISNVILAACCLLVINNMRYYLPKNEKYFYLIVISIVLSIIWLLLLRTSIWAIFKQSDDYFDWLKKSSTIRFSFGFLMIGFVAMLSLLWYGQKAQKEVIQRRAEIENKANEAELNKLRQQLQPHFLFNSLNSISALTGSQPEKARIMIQHLSELLRTTLQNDENLFTTFSNELKYLQLYLDIEKVRFGHRMQTKFEIDEELLQFKLPSMILQPLVENAIKFGLYDTLGEVEIIVKAFYNNNVLEISVANPFDANTALPIKGAGFGLKSIKRRLVLLFNRHDLLITEQQNNLFITTIKIPQL